MFECNSLEGPVPRLFVSNLEEAKCNFTTNLDLAHKDISCITGRMFTAENLHLLHAMAYIDNPSKKLNQKPNYQAKNKCKSSFTFI
jgi:hypothetical protein